MPTPEQLARERIDTLLTAAGWTLQDRGGFDRSAALGAAFALHRPKTLHDWLRKAAERLYWRRHMGRTREK